VADGIPTIPQNSTIKPAPKTLSGFGSNLLSSSQEALTSTATALAPWNLPTTIGTILRLGSGAFQKLIPGEHIDEPVFDAAVEHYKQEWSDPINKLYRDPVGAGMDIATIASPIAASRTLATRAPRVARIANQTVRALDPINEIAIPASATIASESVAGLGRRMVGEGHRYDPKKIYARAMRPSSNLPDGPAKLADLQNKVDIAFSNRATLGSEGSLQRLKAQQMEWVRQKRALEQANPNAPVWLADVQANAINRAKEAYAGRSGFWKMGNEGPEIGPVQRSIVSEVAGLPAVVMAVSNALRTCC